MLTKRSKTMKNTLKFALLCLLAVCAAARGQAGPKLVGEKEIMKLDDEIAYSEGLGMWRLYVVILGWFSTVAVNPDWKDN